MELAIILYMIRAEFSKSHPLVNWARTQYGAKVVDGRDLSRISNLDDANSWVERTGYRINRDVARNSAAAFSVSIFPPEIARASVYHGFQVVIPCFEVDISIPPETFCVNGLMPGDSVEEGQVQDYFAAFQGFVRAISQYVQAEPLACLTGNKTAEPRFALDYRGFRFFYSAQPSELLAVLRAVVSARNDFSDPAVPGTRGEKALKLQSLKGRSIILEDAGTFYSSDTTFVDLLT